MNRKLIIEETMCKAFIHKIFTAFVVIFYYDLSMVEKIKRNNSQYDV